MRSSTPKPWSKVDPEVIDRKGPSERGNVRDFPMYRNNETRDRLLTDDRVRGYRASAYLDGFDGRMIGVMLYWGRHEQLRTAAEAEMALGAFLAGLRNLLALAATPAMTQGEAMSKLNFLRWAGRWLDANPSDDALNASPVLQAAATAEARRWNLQDSPACEDSRAFTIEGPDECPSLREHFLACARSKGLNDVLVEIEGILGDLPALQDDAQGEHGAHVDLRLAVLRAMVTPVRSQMELGRKLLVLDEFADMLAPAWLLGPMIEVTLSADCRNAGATPEQIARLRCLVPVGTA